ncbi:MAG TPA: TRAP transporter large permease [Polyangiaceae bacterium]|nr:TRAP transporter large permease [Polyangiaceae bacterium]
MSAATSPKGGGPIKGTTTGLGIVSALVVAVGVVGGGLAAVVVALALLGTPLFAIMGGASELLWLTHRDESYHHLRYIAANILTEHFAGSPILVTIPLFTFVGYVLAEAKTAERLVRASSALVGWLPGGLAIVCVLASAVFTLFTGGSGVTIIAIGGLLYPALRREGYSEKFSLGVVTSGGSIGLLLPYSLPLMIYSLVAHVDFEIAFKAVIAPGLLVILMFAAYCVYVGVKEKVARKPFDVKEVVASGWELKWELGIPVILVVGLKKAGLSIDECAAAVALYAVLIECFVYRDLSFKKDLPKIGKSAMALGGAVILILSMANALINYVVQEQIPYRVLEFMIKLGIDRTFEFLIAMNIFLLVLGMLMEGFSAILVAVPLILPFAARFHLGPFHTAMIFLVNLELAYCAPPLGLNLFIASFRFNRPAVSLYRPILPFLGVLLASLLLISYVPSISTLTIREDIAKVRARAAKLGAPPSDAWKLECVQDDPNNPLPCTDEERKKYPNGQATPVETAEVPATPPDAGAATEGDGGDQDLLQQMLGAGAADAGAATEAGGGDDLFNELMNAGKDAGGADAGAAAPAPTGSAKKGSDDDLFNQMMNAK